jgi:hypothetical protein
MDIGSFLGLKWPGRSVYQSPSSIAEVKEGVDLYLYSPSGPVQEWTLLLLPDVSQYFLLSEIPIPVRKNPQQIARLYMIRSPKQCGCLHQGLCNDLISTTVPDINYMWQSVYSDSMCSTFQSIVDSRRITVCATQFLLVPIFMMMMCARGFILWIINVGLVIYLGVATTNKLTKKVRRNNYTIFKWQSYHKIYMRCKTTLVIIHVSVHKCTEMPNSTVQTWRSICNNERCGTIQLE